MDTSLPDITHYLVRTACAKGCAYPDLATALTQSSCASGLIVKLKAGETYTLLDYTLPVRDCKGNWIVIESDQLASLPPEGTRVTPTYSEFMPKLTSGNNAYPVFDTRSASTHYRFVGLEFTTSFNGYNTYLILNNGDHYIIDRCYLHGRSNITVNRGVVLDANYSGVIDSYFSDFHILYGQGEAQAVLLPGNNTGPLKLDNNYLEAAGENVLLGGGGNGNAHDVTITHNHFFKPLSWRVGDPHYAGIHWGVKNTLEFKAAQRVLVEGNVFENCWADGQGGQFVLFTPRLQNGITARVDDITFRNNIARHAAGAFGISGWDGDCAPNSGCMHGTERISWDYAKQGVQVHRILIDNNLWEDIGTPWSSDSPLRLFLIVYGASDVHLTHNTFLNNQAFGVLGATPRMTGCQIKDNIFGHTYYGLASVYVTRGGEGTEALKEACGDYAFLNNALVGAKGNSPTYPKSTLYPADWNAVRFVDARGGDYHLREDSRLHRAASDGKDIGADIDAIEKATRGVITNRSGKLVQPKRGFSGY